MPVSLRLACCRRRSDSYSTGRWWSNTGVPLAQGTLVVKPNRQVVDVTDLTGDEAAGLGRVLVVYMPVWAVSRPDRTAASNAS